MDPEESRVIEDSDAVKVFVRLRPLNAREKNNKEYFSWEYDSAALYEVTQNGQRVYAYDRVFGPDEMNDVLYDVVAKPVVLKCMEGYNGTVFSYGQTGSGKTWTMRGSAADPGMMMLCISDIFEFIEEHPLKLFVLRVSYMEVYNEEINDLLGSGPESRSLKIASEHEQKGAIIDKLIEEVVATPDELLAALLRGEESRSYGSTAMVRRSCTPISF